MLCASLGRPLQGARRLVALVMANDENDGLCGSPKERPEFCRGEGGP
jgi:hypothetical protein